MCVNIIEKYGIVPKDVFPESNASTNSIEMNRFLTAKLRDFARDIRTQHAVRDETLSCWSCRSDCLVLFPLISRPCLHLLSTHLFPQIQQAGKTVDELRGGKKAMTDVCLHVLQVHLGTPPEKFDWTFHNKDKQFVAHRDLTPLRFYKELIPFDVGSIRSCRFEMQLRAPSFLQMPMNVLAFL
jgi:bleomycin hydrolase